LHSFHQPRFFFATGGPLQHCSSKSVQHMHSLHLVPLQHVRSCGGESPGSIGTSLDIFDSFVGLDGLQYSLLTFSL
jgi:hypothetical protein